MGVLEEGLMASLKEQYMSQEDRKKIEKSEWKKAIKELINNNKELNEFLETRYIKGEFIKECAKRTSYSEKINVIHALKGVSKRITPINEALIWHNTSKGSNYWNNMDERYKDYRREKEK